MKQLLGVLALLALTSSACLEGDPNPYDKDESSGGSSTNGGSGNSGTAGNGPTGGTHCSLSSTQSVALSFHNRTQRAVQVYWVDYQCQEKLFSDLPVGQTYMISTYATHPWRVRDTVTGALVLEYVASSTLNQDVDINP